MITCSRYGFTLAEILAALVLVGLIGIAVASADVASRYFFGRASEESKLLDEAKIAMEHMVKNIQMGVGDVAVLPGGWGIWRNVRGGRAAWIITSGIRIFVKLDEDGDGQYDPTSASDRMAYYRFSRRSNIIRYYPDWVKNRGRYDIITGPVVNNLDFQFRTDNAGGDIYNQVDVTLTVREDPKQPVSRDNPEFTLTSTIFLREMSIN